MTVQEQIAADNAAHEKLYKQVVSFIETLPSEASFWSLVLDGDFLSERGMEYGGGDEPTQYLFADDTGIYEKRPGDWYLLTRREVARRRAQAVLDTN